MMSSEIYPRAPVQFVAFLAGFPLSPLLQAPGGKEQVYERLQDTFPLLDVVETAIRFQVPLGGGPGGQTQQLPSGPGIPQQLRMTNRERTRAVTLGPRMMLYECTDHESFDQLRDHLKQVLTAVTEVGRPSGIRDVSLQYVDEIRYPGATTPRDWQTLVAPAAVGPTNLLDADAQQTAGIAIYELSPHQQLKVNYAAVADGFAVNPDGPLRVASSEGGPHFRLDLESQWSAPGDDAVPAFDVEPVLAIADELHTPIRDAFERLIQDRLREYFRGNDDA
jgi:uncharacterized protein (TIGR04255 family)